MIGADGLPKNVSVFATSGFALVDKEAVRAMRQAKWKRPRNPVRVKFKLRFKLR
jgi:TonB family protein